MTARRFPAALLFALLSLLAVLQLSAVATWHGALLHDDSPVLASSTLDDHHQAPSQDIDDTIHLVAHILGQGVNVPPLLGGMVATILGASIYGQVAPVTLSGRSPPSLLDPPRS